MSKAIDGLKPELVWKYFAEIARIPRGSKNEAAVSKYVYETARKLGLQAKQDRLGNVVVKKPASRGKERVHPICLQGHLDMVCEKNADKVHDFTKDPIELVRKGNLIMANGTTLGADNGIAVATNLAIMEDRTVEHGPLELLFTIDEETGLTGASNLAGDINISGDILFEISGASRVELSGSGNSARIELSGASQARLANLTLHKASANISGASSAQLKVNDNLDINLSGASRLEYAGSPILGKVQVTGAAMLKQR